ncbi:transposase [Lacipirellula sp.]|uniref:transposase n=1 Tax=Lacipirellula sp. TaxID=2691419 RepID=UPI003D0A336F
MAQTIGYHIVISGHGLWLPGDERGHWSEAWDAELGFVEPHTLHAGDAMRRRMAQERQKFPPTKFTPRMQAVIAAMLERCEIESDWSFAAAAIEATHVHLLMTRTDRDIDNVVKWMKDQTTKAIHRQTPYQRPVWCKGRWRSFIFDEHI